MPKEIEHALMKSAQKKGFEKGSKRWGAYVYGTLAKIKNAGGKKKKGDNR